MPKRAKSRHTPIPLFSVSTAEVDAEPVPSRYSTFFSIPLRITRPGISHDGKRRRVEQIGLTVPAWPQVLQAGFRHALHRDEFGRKIHVNFIGHIRRAARTDHNRPGLHHEPLAQSTKRIRVFQNGNMRIQRILLRHNPLPRPAAGMPHQHDRNRRGGGKTDFTRGGQNPSRINPPFRPRSQTPHKADPDR